MQGRLSSSLAVMLTGSGQRDGRFGTAIAALGDVNLDYYNGFSCFFVYLHKEELKPAFNLLLVIIRPHRRHCMQAVLDACYCYTNAARSVLCLCLCVGLRHLANTSERSVLDGDVD